MAWLPGGNTSLEKALREKKSSLPFPVCSLCFLFVVQDVSSLLPVPAAKPASYFVSGTVRQNKLFCKFPWSWCFITGKVIHVY